MINRRLARLIDLVPFISKHQGIPIADLAKKFGVSTVEIEKDLWLLYCCGLPGQTPLELMEFQFEDGFVSVRNADELKSPRSLTQTELTSLVMGLQLLEANGNQVATQLKTKLARMLNTQVAYHPSGTEIYIPEISSAIQNNEVLNIFYAGNSREIIPLEVYFENHESYLRAHCKMAGARRTFKISKIEKLINTKRMELAPNEVPSKNQQKTTKIRVHKNMRQVREFFGSTEEIRFFSKKWLLDQVLAFGGAVELLDPMLKNEVKERLKASQALYLE